MAGYENFGREYRLAAGQGGSTGFEIGERTTEHPVPPHINFSIEKTDLETQNTGKIEIYNLSKSHISQLEKKNCIVSLRAGYGNHLSLIFAGYVSLVSTAYDSSDRKTTIEVLDSLTAMRDTYISVSYSGKVSWKTIFDDVAAKIGAAVVYSYNATFTYVTNGYSYVGYAKNILTKGCNCCGLTWSIQNGVLQIKKSGDSISQNGYLLSPETGLIEVPERVIVTEDTDTGTKTMGYDVNYMMNGAIGIDDYVHLVSDTVSGYFYVYSLQVQGDNEKGDWICTARLLELSKISSSSSSSSSTSSSSSSNSSGSSYSVGDTVTFNGGYHYLSSTSSSPSGSTRSSGLAQITAIASGASHPYHLIGGAYNSLGGSCNVYGWVDAGTFS